jgi:undecaprenyl-diphosphatase
MLDYLLLGLIQGLTEFLPVSSSGHLFLTEHFLGLEQDMSLEIYLHGASLLAVIIFFWSKIWNLVRDFLQTIQECHSQLIAGNFKQYQETFNQNKNAVLTLKLLTATLITVPVALIVKEFVLVNLTLQTIATALIITGVMILVAEKFRAKQTQEFTWNFVVLLGIIQGMAVIPGISRSGVTIALLILLGIRRKNSAEISFLLSIPTILAALIFILFEQGFSNFTIEVLVASFVCFFASMVAIKWMMKLIESKWIYFVPYCFLLGLGLVLFT